MAQDTKQKQNRIWSVYVLLDPETREVRYVGATRQLMRQRLTNHISQARVGKIGYVSNWIRKLLAEKKRPLAEIIETGIGEGWEAAETRWISNFRKRGARLTNLTVGGNGNWNSPRRGPGWKHTEETRKRMSLSHTGTHIRPEESAARSRRFREKRPETWGRETVEELYVKRQLPNSEIAKIIGCNINTVHVLVKEYGLPEKGTVRSSPQWRVFHLGRKRKREE